MYSIKMCRPWYLTFSFRERHSICVTRVFPRNLPVRSRMVSLQSNSHPGNKISPCKYLREGRTIQPRLRDRVVSSVKQISFRIFLTSLSGTGMPSNFFLTSFLATQTLKPDIQKLFAKLYNSSFNRILLATPFGMNYDVKINAKCEI